MDSHSKTNAGNHRALPTWEGPAIGLLDLDAFFASVEQLDHPAWRGKPVIVGGSPKDRGVVSTASYEARKYGVHSAMPSATAQKLCPNAIWTRGHFDRYRELSHKVMALILDETPLVEQMSIDEAFFDITPGRYSNEHPVLIAERLQERVAALGITCSIGLGTSKTVAKIASETRKPRGLTPVYPGTEQRFLAPLPLSRMSGIGAATERRLRSFGMRTLGDLAHADDEDLSALLGQYGPQLKRRARGLELSPVRPFVQKREPKSVSAEHTFPHDLTTEHDLLAAIDLAAARCGTRLRAQKLEGTVVTLKLRYHDLSYHTAQTPVGRATDDEHVFGPMARRLLPQIWHEGTGVRLVGVGLSGFGREAEPQQLALNLDGAPEPAAPRDLHALSEAADEIRRRFGSSAVSYGRDMRLKGKDVPERPDDEPGGD